MNKELKPCPFCGGIAGTKTDLSDCKNLTITAKKNGVAVGCRGCGVMFIFRPYYSGTFSKDDAINEAVKYWNRSVKND